MANSIQYFMAIFIFLHILLSFGLNVMNVFDKLLYYDSYLYSIVFFSPFI